MADVRAISTDRWRALVAEADAGNPAVTSENCPTRDDADGYRRLDVSEPIEAHGFVFLRGSYRAAN